MERITLSIMAQLLRSQSTGSVVSSYTLTTERPAYEETTSTVSLFTSGCTLLVVQRYTVSQQEENSSSFADLTKLLWKNL